MNGSLFAALCRAHDLPIPVQEWRFAPPRRWRIDFGWVPEKLALEVQGGIFTAGRHVRGAALLKEHEKLNALAERGWRVLFCTPKDVNSGAVFESVKKALEAK